MRSFLLVVILPSAGGGWNERYVNRSITMCLIENMPFIVDIYVKGTNLLNSSFKLKVGRNVIFKGNSMGAIKFM